MLELVFANPAWSIALMLGAGGALSLVIRAFTEPLSPCRRGNCPRCKGRGSEERIRPATPTA